MDRSAVKKATDELFDSIKILIEIDRKYHNLVKNFPNVPSSIDDYLTDISRVTTASLTSAESLASINEIVKRVDVDKKLTKLLLGLLSTYKESDFPAQDIIKLKDAGFTEEEIKMIVSSPIAFRKDMEVILRSGYAHLLDEGTSVLVNFPTLFTSQILSFVGLGIFRKKDKNRKKSRKGTLKKIADTFGDVAATGGGAISVGADLAGLVPTGFLTAASLLGGGGTVYAGAKGIWRRFRPKRCKNSKCNQKLADGFDVCPFCETEQ